MTSRLELHHEGEIIVVQAADAVMGRRSDCELRVIHPLVSRQHCRFEVRPGGVTLVDLGSANGTYVNGERVKGGAALRANDWIRIGTQGPQFQLLRAAVDGEDVCGWDPEAMQETMVAGAPPSTNFTVRVSVGPQARAEPDDLEDRSTPSAVGQISSSIPVALPLETDSHDMRPSDVFLRPPGSDELGPVLIGPDELDPPSEAADAPRWGDADESSAIETGSLGPRDQETGVFATPPEPADPETGEFGRSDETAAAPQAAPRPAPAPTGPRRAPPPTPPPAARDLTAKPADWPAVAPAATPPEAHSRPSPRAGRRWGAVVTGVLVGMLLALAGVAAAAAFTPFGAKLHELVPGARVVELPEDWR